MDRFLFKLHPLYDIPYPSVRTKTRLQDRLPKREVNEVLRPSGSRTGLMSPYQTHDPAAICSTASFLIRHSTRLPFRHSPRILVSCQA